MELLWAGLYLAIITLVGLCVLSAIQGRRDDSLVGSMGMSILLGAGTVGTVLFWLSLAGLRPSAWTVWLLALAAAAGLVVLWRKGRRIALALPGAERDLCAWDWLALLPAAFVTFCVMVGVLQALMPLTQIDAFGIWLLKAKVVHAEPLSSHPALLREPILTYSHQEYPLLVPMLTAGLFATAGQVNDHLGMLVGSFFMLGLAGAAYGFFRRRLGRFWSAALAAILMGLPLMQYSPPMGVPEVGCADLPLAALCGALAFCLCRWVADQKTSDLVLSAVFAVFVASTKNEGTGLIPVVVLVLAAVSLPGLQKRRLVGWCAFVGLFAVLAAPFLLWKAGQPTGGEEYGGRVFSAVLLDNLARLDYLFTKLWTSLSDAHYAGLFWLLLPVLALLGWRAFARRETALLWLLAILQLAVYLAVYVVAKVPPEQLAPGTMPRLLGHIAPAAAALMSLHFAAARKAAAPALARLQCP